MGHEFQWVLPTCRRSAGPSPDDRRDPTWRPRKQCATPNARLPSGSVAREGGSGSPGSLSYQIGLSRVIAKSHVRNGGANLPVWRGSQQGAAHHFGNDFWQSLYTRGSVRKKVVPTSSSLWSQTSPP